MPDDNVTETAAVARLAELIREALMLADGSGNALVAIHLDEALQALGRRSVHQ